MEFNKSLTEKQGDYKNLLSRLCRPIVHNLPLHVLKRLLNIIQEPVNKKNTLFPFSQNARVGKMAE